SFVFQAEDGIRDRNVTGVQTCALPILVAVGEAARDHHRVDTLEVGVGVPERHGLRTGPGDGARRVDVVQGARERDDTDPCTHATTSVRTTFQSSITVLANREDAISSSSASDTVSATSSSNRLPWRTSVTPPWPRRSRARWMAWPCGSRISALGMTSTTTRATVGT